MRSAALRNRAWMWCVQELRHMRENLARTKEELVVKLKERSERLELTASAAERLRAKNDHLRAALADAGATIAALQQELDVLRSVDVYSATLRRQLRRGSGDGDGGERRDADRKLLTDGSGAVVRKLPRSPSKADGGGVTRVLNLA